MSLSSKKCCVPGCLDCGGTKQTLHLFPNPEKDKERFNTWVLKIGGDIIGLEDSDIYKHRRVCHAHFEEKYCCRYNRLSNVAVPTLNLPSPTSFPQYTYSERNPLGQIQNTDVAYVKDVEHSLFAKLQAVPSTSKEPPTYVGLKMKEDVTISSVSAAISHINIPKEDKSSENAGPTTFPQYTYSGRKHLGQIQNTDVAYVKDAEHSLFAKLQALPSTSKDKQAEQHAISELQNLAKENVPASSIQSERNLSASISNLNPKEQKKTKVSDDELGKKKLIPKRVRKRTFVTKNEQELHRKLVQARIKLSKCRCKVKKQAASLKMAKNIATNPRFLKTLESLPSNAKIITLMQLREHKKKNKGRRFSLEEKIVALTIFKQSPKGYRFLRKIFILPAPQTLAKLISQANIKPGINKNMFAQIKQKTEKMKVEERLCILLFDEMSLKPNVTYNERKDRVIGFVNNGEETKPEYSDHAQVFMIRGLMKNYKQPVSYTFSAAATKGPELAKQIKQVIKELFDAGLIVVATVCDQGSNNRQAINLLIQETKGIYLRSGRILRNPIFEISDHEIIPLYDPPHLLKCIRNNLLTKNLQYKTADGVKIAKWEHITQLHNENPGYKGIRLVPKLTDSHVKPEKIQKMKVKYATQVFSQTVASNMGYLADKGIIPKDCKNTADILIFFDQLFDSVNGSYSKKGRHAKPLLGPVKPNSVHHKVWMEAKKTLGEMKFLKSNGQPENVPALKNWVWTLEGIQLLLKKIETEYNITSVWMRHLNQDPIENFFGAIRSHGCRNTNPTPEKFESAFTSLLINSISSVHTPGTNCENDSCSALQALIITKNSKVTSACDLNYIPDLYLTPLENKADPRIIGALTYVSGYFLKKAKTNVFQNCEKCNNDLFSPDEHDYIKCREYADKKWLCNASDSLLLCISNLQDINNCIIKENLNNDNLKEFIKTLILINIEFDFLNCNKHKDELIDYIINLSSRFFIYNYCKELNKVLCGKRDCDDDNDSYKYKAKKMFLKCYKRKHSNKANVI